MQNKTTSLPTTSAQTATRKVGCDETSLLFNALKQELNLYCFDKLEPGVVTQSIQTVSKEHKKVILFMFSRVATVFQCWSKDKESIATKASLLYEEVAGVYCIGSVYSAVHNLMHQEKMPENWLYYLLSLIDSSERYGFINQVRRLQITQ